MSQLYKTILTVPIERNFQCFVKSSKMKGHLGACGKNRIAIWLCLTAHAIFFPKFWKHQNEFYKGLRRRLTAKALGPRLVYPLFHKNIFEKRELEKKWKKTCLLLLSYKNTRSNMVALFSICRPPSLKKCARDLFPQVRHFYEKSPLMWYTAVQK